MRYLLPTILMLLVAPVLTLADTLFSSATPAGQAVGRPGEVIVLFSRDGAAQMSRGSRPGRMAEVFERLGATEVSRLDATCDRAARRISAARRFSVQGSSDANAATRSLSSTTAAAQPFSLIPDDDLLSRVCLLRYDTTLVASVDDALLMLSSLNEIELAEPNLTVRIQPLPTDAASPLCSGTAAALPASPQPSPLPARYAEQWYLQAINMPQLWQVPVIHDKRPVVAIVDTGVDTTHPDLKDNIAEGGYDFVADTTIVSDVHGHGTHCAGLVAAKGLQVIGANPNALVMPITVVDSLGSGGLYDILLGIVHAVNNGADIISLSLGTYGSSALYHSIADFAARTAIIVAAAGNDGFCMHSTHRDLHGMALPHLPCLPAAYECTIGVMATTEDGQLATWSNFDCNGPLRGVTQAGFLGWGYQLRVPGNHILSTLPGGQYGQMSGTSMATPLAAGVISRLLQCRDFSSRDEMLRTLIMTTRGHIDVMAAYQASEATLHPGVFTEEYDGQLMTFAQTSDSTAQLGDGTVPAIPVTSIPDTLRVPDEVRGLAVTALAPRALEGCSRLCTLCLGCNVEAIGDRALSGCDALAELAFATRFPPEAPATAFDSRHFQTVTLRNARGYAENFRTEAPWSSFSRWQELDLTTGNRFWDIVDTQGTRMSFIIYSLPAAIAQVGDGETCIDTLRAGHLTIPASVRGLRVLAIAEEAFSRCKLLTSLTLPQTLTNIWYKAFYGCSALTEVELPPHVSYIGTYAFNQCSSLRTLKLSSGLTDIDNYAFAECPRLQTIIVPCATPPAANETVFLTRVPYSTGGYNLNTTDGNIYRNATLYVPYGCRARYAKAHMWMNFRHIEELADDAVCDIPHTPTRQQQYVYDLTGRKYINPQQLKPGLYIVDGKKKLKN